MLLFEKRQFCFTFGIVFVLLLVSSCFWDGFWEWIDPDDEPLLQQRYYEGDNLRLNGYYYEDVDEYHSAQLFVLYRNGVVLSPGSSELSKANERINHLVESVDRRDYIDEWGLFDIDDSVIRVEYYLPSMYGHHTYLMIGEILNDSTFHMTKGKRSDKSDYGSIDHLYRFHKTDAKPDSTNNFFH